MLKHSSIDAARWDDSRGIFNFFWTQLFNTIWPSESWGRHILGKARNPFIRGKSRGNIHTLTQNFRTFSHKTANNGSQRLKVDSLYRKTILWYFFTFWNFFGHSIPYLEARELQIWEKEKKCRLFSEFEKIDFRVSKSHFLTSDHLSFFYVKHNVKKI